MKNIFMARVKVLFAGLVLVAALAVQFHYFLIAFFILIYLISTILPIGWFFALRLISSYFVFYVISLSFGFLSLFANIPIDAPSMLYCGLALVLVTGSFRNPGPSLLPKIRLYDLVVVTALSAVFLVMILPFRGLGPAGQIYILSQGEDNASHYAIYNNIVRSRAYVYFKSANDSGILKDLVSYPQGLHVNMAVNTEILEGKTSNITPQKLIRDYAIQISLFMSLMAGLLISALIYIADGMFKRKTILAVLAILSAPLYYFLLFGTNLYLPLRGYQSQIVAYTLLLILYLVLAGKESLSLDRLILSGLFLVGITNTWYFITPVGVALLAIRLWPERRRLIKLPLVYFTGFITLALCLLPLYTNVAGPGTPGGLNAKGAVWHIPFQFIVISFVAYVVALFTRKLNKDAGFRRLSYLIGLCIIFSTILGVYQKATIGSLQYYFFKSFYIIPPLTIIAFSLVCMVAVEAISKAQLLISRVNILVVCLFSSALWILIANSLGGSELSQYMNKTIPGYTNDTIITKALTTNTRDVITYKLCTPLYGYANERWTAAILMSENDERLPLYSDAILKTESPAKLLAYTSRHPSIVFYSSICTPKGDIAKLADNKNIHLMPIEL